LAIAWSKETAQHESKIHKNNSAPHNSEQIINKNPASFTVFFGLGVGFLNDWKIALFLHKLAFFRSCSFLAHY
jgi:hypothetical protein